MKRMKLLSLVGCICLILTLVVIPLNVGCSKAETPEVKYLDVGVVAGLTGQFAAGATLKSDGATVAAEMINEEGGITVNGQKYLINLIVEDTKMTAEGAQIAASKLVYDHGVKFVVDCIGMTFTTEGAGTVTEPAKVLRVMSYNAAMPGELGPEIPYTFMAQGATLEYAQGGFRYVKEHYPECKTVTYVQPDVGAEVILNPKINEFCANPLGITEAGIALFPFDQVDYAPIAVKAEATGGDFYFIPMGWPEQCGAFLKALREKGSDKLVATFNMCDGRFVVEAAGEAASTNFLTGGFSVREGIPIPSMLQEIPLLQKGIEKSLDKLGWCTPGVVEGMNTVWVLSEAIEGAQSFDTTEVKDWWEKQDTLENFYGTGRLGGQVTYGINHALCHPIPVESLENGEVKHVAWQEVFSP